MVKLRVNAQIKWDDPEMVGRMESHLEPYSIDRTEALTSIFGGTSEEQIRNTEISIRCGTTPAQSCFVFVRGAGNTSQITGYCPTNRMDHFLEDFEYLTDQMNSSEELFFLSDIHIRLNDEKLVKKSAWNYLLKRSVLTDLFAMIGLIPFASTWLLSGELSSNVIYPFAVGLILWFATFLVGYGSEQEYVLKK